MKKYSRQRELILESLKNRTDHPTAEKLFMDLKQQMPEIGIATVYRNLTELCQDGSIIKIKTKNGPDRYDGNNLPHIHFECKNCGDFEDIYLNEIQINRMHQSVRKLVDEIDADYDSSEVYVMGICKKCKLGLKKNA